MRYRYAYRTAEGERREAEIEAASRDAAFAELRRRGIRPIKVVAEDGSRENGEISATKTTKFTKTAGVGVALALVFVIFVVLVAKDKEQGFTEAQTRRQVIGDTAVVDKGIATGWADVFADEGERFFASFAIPGVKAGLRNTTVEEIRAALARRVAPMPGDGMEARQIKAMVEGMKAEARAYVAAGGTIAQYGQRLTERQDAEIAIYERTRTELEQARMALPRDEFLSLWEDRNDQLRNLGIRLVPLED